VFAAITFTVARMAFTTVMAGSSYTMVYGAFAAVPLFLMWIYVTWVIILIGAVLTHSLSAYQTQQQATKSNLIKTLEILNAFWLAQKQGHSIAELSIICSGEPLSDGIDVDSWRHIRDTLIGARFLRPLEKGHYLLSRDLNQVTLSELLDIVRAQPPFQPRDHSPPWQHAVAALIERHQEQESSLLAISLADLFAAKAA
jgi:membrane protein